MLEKKEKKQTMMDKARSIAWKNHVPIEIALMWARMPIDVEKPDEESQWNL
jgi:hypothetical protein